MFQFNYKLKVSERVKAKCNRHPRYNPERDGRGGIKGGCSTCFSLFDLHQARLSLDAAHREFLRRASPWTRVPRLRTKSQSVEQNRPQMQGTSLLRYGVAFAAPLFTKNTAVVSKSAPLISPRW
jgi:hypothetical protein